MPDIKSKDLVLLGGLALVAIIILPAVIKGTIGGLGEGLGQGIKGLFKGTAEGAVEGGKVVVGTVGQTYTWVDAHLFGGVLPGGEVKP